MKKLSLFIKSGKGRGLKFVFWTILLISFAVSGAIYYAGNTLLKNPVLNDFIDSVPSFVIHDGQIQDRHLKWAARFPIQNVPVVIDTTIDNISLPVPDGVYLTRTALFTVANRGTQAQRFPLSGTQLVSPFSIKAMLWQSVLFFAIGLFVFAMIVSWLMYLVTVALTALLACLIQAPLVTHRAWKVSSITWTIGLVLSLVLVVGGFYQISTLGMSLISVLINVIILARLKN